MASAPRVQLRAFQGAARADLDASRRVLDHAHEQRAAALGADPIANLSYEIALEDLRDSRAIAEEWNAV